MTQPLERTPSLDGLRGVAILAVLSCHLIGQPLAGSGLPYAHHPFVSIFSLGWGGVSLFFVLSGYLIFSTGVKRRNQNDFVADFWRRRVLRLLPLYLILILSAPLAVELFKGSPIWDRAFDQPLSFWYYASFTQNIGMLVHPSAGIDWLDVTWSLAIEIQFYVIACALIYLLPPARLKMWLWVLIAGCVVFRQIHQAHSPNPLMSVWFLTPCRFDCFALGGILALSPRPGTGKPQTQYAIWALFITASLVSLLLWFGLLQKWTSLNQPTANTLSFSAHGLCFASLLWLSLAGGWMGRLLEFGFLREAGKISYFLYLFHIPFALTIYHLIAGNKISLSEPIDWVCLPTTLLLLYCAAKISQRYLEEPCIRWKWSRKPRLEAAT